MELEKLISYLDKKTGVGVIDNAIKKIKNEKWAYWWAFNIGDQDLMIEKIKTEKWAYWWALGIGNRDVMICGGCPKVDYWGGCSRDYRAAIYKSNCTIHRAKCDCAIE